MDKIDRLINNKLFITCMDRIKDEEKDRIFCLHGIEHSLDVARIGYILSLEQKLNIDKDIIYGMALLHDIGRCVEYESNISHHEAGVEISQKILAESGYEHTDITAICDAIANHKNKSLDCNNVLRELLYTADKLSRNCFSCKAYEQCYWSAEKKNEGITI